MKPLAYLLRPTKFSEILGQNHLVGKDGILTKMIENKKPMSFILYGNPGSGKTTIANVFSSELAMETYFFNASTDNKARLIDILNVTNFNDILIIIDEIHRMKTDIQDYLLPFVESGKAVFIGLTTINPYHSVNWAIRSRSQIFKMEMASDDDIKQAIEKALNYIEIDITLGNNVMDSLIRYSNHEIRSALNLLEASLLYLKDGDILSNDLLLRIAGSKKHSLDKSNDNFYLLLSALQKSIRGSDVDASLHYLARLITLEDLDSIIRRLLVISYEDIGLANPNIAQKVLTASNACKIVGFPEARIILSNVVIEMALSPKSNTAYLAIDKALSDYENIDTGQIPNYLDNNQIKLDPSIYKYPHDDLNSINEQTYLPEKIKFKNYYFPKDESNYEKALKSRLELIDKTKGIRRNKK